MSGRGCSLEQVSHSGQQVVAICADKKIRLCELGREGGVLPRAGRTRHLSLANATKTYLVIVAVLHQVCL